MLTNLILVTSYPKLLGYCPWHFKQVLPGLPDSHGRPYLGSEPLGQMFLGAPRSHLDICAGFPTPSTPALGMAGSRPLASDPIALLSAFFLPQAGQRRVGFPLPPFQNEFPQCHIFFLREIPVTPLPHLGQLLGPEGAVEGKYLLILISKDIVSIAL